MFFVFHQGENWFHIENMTFKLKSWASYEAPVKYPPYKNSSNNNDWETRASSVLDFVGWSIERHLTLIYSRYRRTLFTAWQIPRRSPQLQLATGISHAWNLTSEKVCANCSCVMRPRPSRSPLFPIPRLSLSLLKNTYTHTRYLQCREYILFISFGEEEKERDLLSYYSAIYEYCTKSLRQPSKNLVVISRVNARSTIINNEVLG